MTGGYHGHWLLLKRRVPCASFFVGRGFCLDSHRLYQRMRSMRTKPLFSLGCNEKLVQTKSQHTNG